jgi:hypothetical protein
VETGLKRALLGFWRASKAVEKFLKQFRVNRLQPLWLGFVLQKRLLGREEER